MTFPFSRRHPYKASWRVRFGLGGKVPRYMLCDADVKPKASWSRCRTSRRYRCLLAAGEGDYWAHACVWYVGAVVKQLASIVHVSWSVSGSSGAHADAVFASGRQERLETSQRRPRHSRRLVALAPVVLKLRCLHRACSTSSHPSPTPPNLRTSPATTCLALSSSFSASFTTSNNHPPIPSRANIHFPHAL